MRLSLHDNRYKLPASTRKFGGKSYLYLMAETSKRDAEQTADNWRKRGYSVRIAPWKRNYSVYTRKER